MDLAIDPQSSIADLSAPRNAQGELKQACQQFESFFLQAVFKSMRQAMPEGALIERGSGQEWFEQAFDAEVAQGLASGQGVGLAEALYQQMSAGPGSAGQRPGYTNPGEGLWG